MLEKPTNSCGAGTKKKPYDNSPCEGCYLNYLTVYNTRTGKSHKPHCKSYSCEKHGWKHAKRLQEAIEATVSEWDKIRFWTFTLSSKLFNAPEEHSKCLSKIWRYFVTELRRNKILSESDRKVDYIRVSEMHKSGYIHFHCFFNRYIHFSKIYALWLRATEVVLGRSDKVSGCYVVGNRNAKTVAKYVSKYVTKLAKQKIKYANLYSTSGNITLFGDPRPKDAYAVYDSKRKIWLGLRVPLPLLVSEIEHHHTILRNEAQLFKHILGSETIFDVSLTDP